MGGGVEGGAGGHHIVDQADATSVEAAGGRERALHRALAFGAVEANAVVPPMSGICTQRSSDPARLEPGHAERPQESDGRWTARLVLFLRVMAVLAVFKGLYHWAQVTGFVGGEEEAFEYQPMAWQTATVYFAVIDLVAAVGLWLATPWGGVLWLLIASAQIFVTLSIPGFFVGGYLLIGVNAFLIMIYFALTFEAGRDDDAQRLYEKRRQRKAENEAEPKNGRRPPWAPKK